MPTHCGLGHWRTIQTLCSGPAPAVVTLQVMAVMVAMVAMVASPTPCRAGGRRKGRPARQATQRCPAWQGGDSLAWGQSRKTSTNCHPQKSHQHRIEGCANGHRHGHDTAMTPLTPLGLRKRLNP